MVFPFCDRFCLKDWRSCIARGRPGRGQEDRHDHSPFYRATARPDRSVSLISSTRGYATWRLKDMACSPCRRPSIMEPYSICSNAGQRSGIGQVKVEVFLGTFYALLTHIEAGRFYSRSFPNDSTMHPTQMLTTSQRAASVRARIVIRWWSIVMLLHYLSSSLLDPWKNPHVRSYFPLAKPCFLRLQASLTASRKARWRSIPFFATADACGMPARHVCTW